MKKFILAFGSFVFILCIALLIINYPNGNVDTDSHLRLDLWVATFNNTLKNNNDEGLIGSMNYLINFTKGKFPIPALKELGVVGMWIFKSMVEIVNVCRAVITTFSTPVIF